LKKIPIIVIGGPTASGKTALSIALAKRFGGCIISADSMQIYQHMDIGSAKPTEAEREGIRHELMDIVSPLENFSLADYLVLAHDAIEKAVSRGELPIVIGGTGLYINSLVDDVCLEESESDPELRKELTKIGEEQGGEVLLRMLREFDPESAERLHPNNLRRIVRAIEVYRLTGKTMTEQMQESRKKPSRYEPLMLAIRWDMKKLYERIEKRVDIMLGDGLEAEVRMLWDMGCNKHMTSMQGIGYKQFLNYFHGLTTLSETVNLIKRDSRRYAKRQMTWFRRDERICWLDAEKNPIDTAILLCEDFVLANFEKV